MNDFYYVYILVSETNDKAHYSGLTRNLNARLSENNRGNARIHQRTDCGRLRPQSLSDRKRKLAVLSGI
jgi:predicted GIY-YIG superfamily endonuclease